MQGIVKTFHVRPLKREKKWQHLRWKVIVVDDYEDVKRLWKENGGDGRSARNVHAFAQAYRNSELTKRDGKLGVIVLQVGDGAGVTSHETLHAAVRTQCYMQTGQCSATRLRWDEEELARIVGNLNREIVNAGWRYGIYDMKRNKARR